MEIKSIVTIQVLADDGQVLQPGDTILLRIKTEDIVCEFKEISNGYFVTGTIDGRTENKYRQTSIDSCRKIKPIEWIPAQNINAAAKEAAQEAGRPALAPAN